MITCPSPLQKCEGYDEKPVAHFLVQFLLCRNEIENPLRLLSTLARALFVPSRISLEVEPRPFVTLGAQSAGLAVRRPWSEWMTSARRLGWVNAEGMRGI